MTSKTVLLMCDKYEISLALGLNTHITSCTCEVTKHKFSPPSMTILPFHFFNLITPQRVIAYSETQAFAANEPTRGIISRATVTTTTHDTSSIRFAFAFVERINTGCSITFTQTNTSGTCTGKPASNLERAVGDTIACGEIARGGFFGDGGAKP